MREKLLLRQLDVIAQQSVGRGFSTISSVDGDISKLDGNGESDGGLQMNRPVGIKFIIDEEEEDALFANIRSFGRFQLGNINLTLQNVYLRHEDYIRPSKDHEIMNKCLQLNANEIKTVAKCNEKEEDDQIKVISQGSNIMRKEDNCMHFAKNEIIMEEENDDEIETETELLCLNQNKLLMENTCRQISESIINLTLEEAKKLLNQSHNKIITNFIPALNLQNVDDEIPSSHVDAISSLVQDQDLTHTQSTQQTETQTQTNNSIQQASNMCKQRCKHKITINNCNGTINLRNISSLIINCTGEDAVNTELSLQQAENTIVTTTATTIEDTSNHLEAPTSTQLSTSATTISTSSATNNNCHCNNNKIITKNNITKHKNKRQEQHKSQHHKVNSGSFCNSNKNKNTQIKHHQSEQQLLFSRANNCDKYENDDETTAATCEFYNNLLMQIKNSLVTNKQHIDLNTINENVVVIDNDDNDNDNENNDFSYYLKHQTPKNHNDIDDFNNENGCDDFEQIDEEISKLTSISDINDNEATNSTQSQQQQQQSSSTNNRRLVLKNFENLKIILEANSDEETSHPVQIEQWLAEIISESDLEPVANSDFLEHSKISN